VRAVPLIRRRKAGRRLSRGKRPWTRWPARPCARLWTPERPS